MSAPAVSAASDASCASSERPSVRREAPERNTVEVITSEDRFWDACRCAPLVMGYVTDLLGVEATRWEFGKAIVRSGHVSTLFVCTSVWGESLELWVSATHQGPDGWTMRHTELPERQRR